MPLTGFFRGYVDFYYEFRVAQLNNRRKDYFLPLFFVLKMYGTPSLHAIKCVVDKKHVVLNIASLCVVLLVRTYFEVQGLHKSTNHVDLSEVA